MEGTPWSFQSLTNHSKSFLCKYEGTHTRHRIHESDFTLGDDEERIPMQDGHNISSDDDDEDDENMEDDESTPKWKLILLDHAKTG